MPAPKDTVLLHQLIKKQNDDEKYQNPTFMEQALG